MNKQKAGQKISDKAFIAPGCTIMGEVVIEEEASVWPSAVLRGDMDRIHVGKATSIQDNVTVHTNEGSPTHIGDSVTVGHNAVIHAATVADYCIIGMGAIILDKAKVGTGSIVGAGAVVTAGTEIPPNSLVLGMPAKVVKQGDYMDRIKANAQEYLDIVKRHLKGEIIYHRTDD